MYNQIESVITQIMNAWLLCFTNHHVVGTTLCIEYLRYDAPSMLDAILDSRPQSRKGPG